MKEVFLDTSALCAIANRRDQWHAAAEEQWKGL
jgi:predicted nucleic acid-binding protein